MNYTEHGCPRCPHRLFGIVVCLLATACFALGIADVVYTYSVYCYAQTSGCSGLRFNLTWVGVGIWASVPVFLAGLSAVWLKHTDSKNKRIYLILCSVSALLFTPALVIISTVEVWQGRDWFYGFPPSAMSGSDVTKLSVPLTIIVLGAVLFLLISAALVWECCDGLTWTQPGHDQHQQHASSHEVETHDRVRWRRGPRRRSAGGNNTGVYVLEVPVVGIQAPRTPFVSTQCQVHGVSRLQVSSYAPCEACMERSRRGVGNWSRSSPF